MPINSSNHKLGDLYSNIYKKKQNQINESTRSQVVKESLKSNYFSSTPFHKYLSDYDQMYSGYRSSVILKESYKNDINTAMYLMQRNPELCNEIFGAIGQKIKQGVQAGAQAVQNKLLQPIINMIISKLPKAKQEELAKAAEGGEQALQQFIQKEGDPNISNQVASQNAPVAESRDHELMHAYQILSILTMNTSGVISEDAAQNKFKNFQKTLNQIASEIKDPTIQQQAQALSSYIQQNYTTRGTVKGAAKPGTAKPGTAKPGAAPAQQTPVAPKAGGAGPLALAGGQAGPLAATGPGGEINVTPGGPQRAPTTATASTASAAPTAQGGGSSLIGKIGSFIKNNPKLSAAAALGLIGAIGAATGGIGFVTPMIAAGLKGAGVGGLVGAAKGAIGAKSGERLKGALKGGLSGAATGGLAGAAVGLTGQALGGTGAPVDQGSEVNPNAQSPESLGIPEVDQGSEVNPNAESPESLNSQPGIDTDQIEPGSPEDPNQGMYTQPEQPTAPAAPAQQPAATGQPAGSARGGAADLQQMGNQAQAQKAAANLQPGEVLKKDTLGRTFRVKAK